MATEAERKHAAMTIVKTATSSAPTATTPLVQPYQRHIDGLQARHVVTGHEVRLRKAAEREAEKMAIVAWQRRNFIALMKLNLLFWSLAWLLREILILAGEYPA